MSPISEATRPSSTVDEAAGGALEPSLVVLSAVTSDRVHAAVPQLQALASRYRVALGGDGVIGLDSSGLDVLVLAGDPVAEAARVTGLVGVANGVTRA